MNTPPDDIDARLARREPLFRRASAAPLEPPAEIDRIVLARARAALRDTGGDEAPRPSFFTLRPWVMPLGLAATMVFALAVVVRLGPGACAPATRAETETDLRRDAPAATAAVSTPAAAADAPLAAPTEPKPAAAPKAGKGVSEERMVARASMEAAREAESSNTEAAEMPAAGRVQASPPAPAALAAPAPPPPAAALGDASADTLAKASGGAALNLPASQATAVRSEVPDFQANPELWYRKIVELRSKGERRAADREWRALKARYPDFEAPPRTTAQ